MMTVIGNAKVLMLFTSVDNAATNTLPSNGSNLMSQVTFNSNVAQHWISQSYI